MFGIVSAIHYIHSYVLNAGIDVTIEDGVTIHSAIICDGAVIRRGSVIPRGCIISFGVEVGPNTRLSEYVRITKVFNACLDTSY